MRRAPRERARGRVVPDRTMEHRPRVHGFGWKNDVGLKRLGLVARRRTCGRAGKPRRSGCERCGRARWQVTVFVEGIEFAVGLEERILHDVLAVHDGAGHACAVAVKTRAQMREMVLKEGDVARLEEAPGGREVGGKHPYRASRGLRRKSDAREGGAGSRYGSLAALELLSSGAAKSTAVSPQGASRAGGAAKPCRRFSAAAAPPGRGSASVTESSSPGRAEPLPDKSRPIGQSIPNRLLTVPEKPYATSPGQMGVAGAARQWRGEPLQQG